MASPATSPVPATKQAPLRRDDVYYFQNVTFLVEDTLFRVPKVGFNVPGTPFEAMFTLPQNAVNEADQEGQSDSNPIRLNQVSKTAFRAFLSVLYPFRTKSKTFDDLTGILELSSMWCFDNIKLRAIKSLTQMFDAEKADRVTQILLGKRYAVPEWLEAGCTSLVKRGFALTPHEVSYSGLQTILVAKIYACREVVYREMSNRKVSPKQHAGQCQCSSCLASDDGSYSSAFIRANRDGELIRWLVTGEITASSQPQATPKL